MMTQSNILATFVCGLDFNAIPLATITRAKQLMLDTLGVGLSGSRHPTFTNALTGVSTIPGSAGSFPVLGSNTTLALPYAALVNGVACHVLDFDDTHTASIVHGSAILVPLVLALGQELGASGRDVLVAFVAGWEVAARIGIASGNSFHNRGFHSTAIAGIFGATAAAGRLLGLSQEQMTNAFGLAGSQAAGITEFLTNSSSSKGYHVGFAAQSAITTAYISRSGATGPTTVFEGRNGIFQTHGLPDLVQPARTTVDLGVRWEVDRVSIKPYPCCHFAHGSVDCAIALKEDGVTADQIKGIKAIIDEVAAGFVCYPIESKYRPPSTYAAKFSLPYLVACGLVDGGAGPMSFTEHSIRRHELLSLAHKVDYVHAEKGTTGFPRYFPGHLVVELHDGRIVEKRTLINRGNPDAPLSDEEVSLKFHENATGVVSVESARRIIDAIAMLDRTTDIQVLTREIAVAS